jgi:hypothetical protein
VWKQHRFLTNGSKMSATLIFPEALQNLPLRRGIETDWKDNNSLW